MKDYDVSRHLTQLIARVAPDKRTLTRSLWLCAEGQERQPDIVVIDAEPARGPKLARLWSKPITP
jgi:hypothetical protein